MLLAAVWDLTVKSKSKRKRYMKKKRTLSMVMSMRCGWATVCSLAN